MEDDELYVLALTRIGGLGNIGANNLIKSLGSAKAVFDNRANLHNMINGVSPKLSEALNSPYAFEYATKELNFAKKNGIECLTICNPAYPSRLRQCPDAPLALFYRGNADLNVAHIISIVGTRNITRYGMDSCSHFVEELSNLVPDVVVVSGLAYGVDVQAHKTALRMNLNTIGVLAHGLDRIYPTQHRRYALDMMNHGGLLTEYPSNTSPDRQNFIRRNRIIAGMCDAVLVVESAEKGGALITADIADSYGRDCFAFPGNIDAPYSLGCNNLIRDNKATLVSSASDVVELLGWVAHETKPVVQRELFPDLTIDEQQVVNILKNSPDGIHINKLVVDADMPVNKISVMLFEMEMRGVVRSLAGGVYKLI